MGFDLHGLGKPAQLIMFYREEFMHKLWHQAGLNRENGAQDCLGALADQYEAGNRVAEEKFHTMIMNTNNGSGPSLGALIAGGAAAAAAAYGAHQLSQGAHNLTHGGFYGRQGKFKRGKHGRFGKRGGKFRKWK
ncbi:hypothetical protein TEA_026035 [Camellia sinensis var. sinensis]|uniref:Uncharacterized protein n=1 Tax=Camellia sinensis var. sinensis TaxID=542762 RepID=A0A4V3WKK3_CAMSN|nr:hypothetical protein TEA_026035 [Camellia sinensis var. sinensis]